MKLTGSEILIECLKAEGVKTIFDANVNYYEVWGNHRIRSFGSNI